MTEQEWLACAEPMPMLEWLRDKVSDRKLRLFAVACCRCIWSLIDLPRREAAELVEQYADGLATKEQMDAAKASLNVGRTPYVPSWPVLRGSAKLASRAMPGRAAELEAGVRPRPHDHAADRERWSVEASAHSLRRAASLLKQSLSLRDIFGNPFRPVTVHPSWLTDTVVSLASAIYDERAFDRLPILGDALEDAGCTNAEILNHCRQPGDHVQGCWVVDLVLAKT